MWIDHRKQIRRRANAWNVSFRISLRWPIHIINPVDKTRLSYSTKWSTFSSLSKDMFVMFVSQQNTNCQVVEYTIDFTTRW